jgi:tyrosine-protein phosphatase SIW14
MTRWLQIVLGGAVALLLITAPVLFAFHQQRQMRNFREVRKGVLYRSGQMSPEGLAKEHHEYHFKTIVSLRDAMAPGLPAPDAAEEEFCNKEEIAFLRLPPYHWEGEEGTVPPVEENVRKFRAVMADPKNYPVLVHCFAGIHRTGAYTAIYRMEFEGWSNARAIAEVKACGYKNLDEEWDVLTYLERYRPAKIVGRGP